MASPVAVQAPPADTRERVLLGGVLLAAIRVLIVVAVVAGIAMRAWYMFHRPVSSDEAIVGLMARQIQHGHFYTFYWGQAYGGAEPYLLSALFFVFGSSAWVLRLLPLVLSVALALLTWRATRRLVRDGAIAALAGAVVWATPDSAVANAFIEWGFRGLAVVCGAAMVLLVLRILDGDRRWWSYGALGAVSGFGWWATPEIAYFALPTVVLLVAALVREYRESSRRLVVSAGATVAAAAVAAMPWIYTNAHTGLRSLHTSAFGVQPGNLGYGGRLRLFFKYSLGMLASLRDLYTGNWLGGRTVGLLLLAAILLVVGTCVLSCFARRDRAAAIALGVVAFPFLLAASPASWLWIGGRYIGYAVPLIAMAVAAGAEGLGRAVGHRLSPVRGRLSLGAVTRRTVALGAAAFLVATTLASFSKVPTPGMTLAQGWTDPNGATAPTIRSLERQGIVFGYAPYWAAYRVDFLSYGRLQFAVGKGELDRTPALTRKVGRDGRAAFVFVNAGAVAGAQFGSPVGPGGLTESVLAQRLQKLGVAYRVVDAGLLTAVVPDTPVPPAAIWAG